MTDWLAQRARRCGDRPALIDGDSTVTWAGLAAIAGRCAARLGACGVAAGDPVFWQGRADAAAIGWLHGVLWRGAHAVPLPADLPAETIAALADRLRPAAQLVADPGHRAWQRAGVETLALDETPTDGAPVSPPSPADPERVLVVMRTSGTGGDAKLVPLRARHVEASVFAVGRRLGLQSTDRWLLCMPPDHIGGLAILMRSLRIGSAVRLHRRFDAGRVAAEFRAGAVTHASLVPTMLGRVVERLQPPLGGALRCVLVGGAPTAAQLLDRARSLGVPAVPTWGMTEAGSQLATLAPGEASNIDLAEHPGLVGRPLRGVEIRAGGIGEPEVLRVRGPMLFDGYAGAPAGAAPDADGWFTTGDRGYVDAAGMLYVTGRAGARIISGGENVEPGIVEALIRNSGLVGDVGLVGVPDEDWGQRVVALVESDRTAAELEAWARAHLEPAQRPRQWIGVDALPRNRTGKLRRDELLRLAGSK